MRSYFCDTCNSENPLLKWYCPKTCNSVTVTPLFLTLHERWQLVSKQHEGIYWKDDACNTRNSGVIYGSYYHEKCCVRFCLVLYVLINVFALLSAKPKLPQYPLNQTITSHMVSKYKMTKFTIEMFEVLKKHKTKFISLKSTNEIWPIMNPSIQGRMRISMKTESKLEQLKEIAQNICLKWGMFAYTLYQNFYGYKVLAGLIFQWHVNFHITFAKTGEQSKCLKGWFMTEQIHQNCDSMMDY